MSQLEDLRESTVIVSDTGDIDAIKVFSPKDSTTNPSLILKATAKQEYKHLIDEAVSFGKKAGKDKKETISLILDKLFVNFGLEILKIIPGRVSTEVESRLSFDVDGSIERARRLIQFYKDAGISKDRILIKLASTWEGTLAAAELEKEGIHCNMTLLFSLPQAVASANAKATLVSPFVGRISDWFKAHKPDFKFTAENDPGVESVRTIYNYYKKFGIKTEVMGASFRYLGQILELSGCDLLTISPQLLQELSEAKGSAPRKLDPAKAHALPIEKMELDEKTFRWYLNEDQMATEKLSEGIRIFNQDTLKLIDYIDKNYGI